MSCFGATAISPTVSLNTFMILYLWFGCTGAIPLSTALFGRGNATILVRDFRCTGREQSLQQCTPSNYSISSYYSHGSYVSNRYVVLFSLSYSCTMKLVGMFTWNMSHMILFDNHNHHKFILTSEIWGFIISEAQFTSFFQRPSCQCYLSGEHHLSVWVQLWRSSSCWWREGEWGQSGDLCGRVLGDCVWQWVWKRRGSCCMQATGQVIRYVPSVL